MQCVVACKGFSYKFKIIMENSTLQIFKTTAISDSVGVIPAKPLCDFFGLDWSNQQKMLKNDILLAQLMVKKPSTGIDGKTYEMIHFTKKGFLRWVQLINYNIVKEELRNDFIDYQLQIFDFLFESHEQQYKMQVEYKRMNELEAIINDAQTELKAIKKNIGIYLNERYGQTKLEFVEQKILN